MAEEHKSLLARFMGQFRPSARPQTRQGDGADRTRTVAVFDSGARIHEPGSAGAAIQHVVDDRVFLLGLDQLYREAMRRHEADELLRCARRVAEALRVAPLRVPVEGYYAEDERLTEYFRLIRALQTQEGSGSSSVGSLTEFRRLREVVASPLFGVPQFSGKLLPAARDALSQALLETPPDQWTVVTLTAAAHTKALATDDISLVGLAARIQDPVVLAALRESVVLYADAVLGAWFPPKPPEHVWKVDGELARQAKRFIDTFNTLFGEQLPAPDAAHAEHYWSAYGASDVVGRCVRLGFDDSTTPGRHYHWAIYRSLRERGLALQEFWQPEVWTTARYRSRAYDSNEGRRIV